jgi:hypothetical protein
MQARVQVHVQAQGMAYWLVMKYTPSFYLQQGIFWFEKSKPCNVWKLMLIFDNSVLR